MKKLLGKAPKTVKVPFMDTEEVEVRKLTVAQVREFQKSLKEASKIEDEEQGLRIQRNIIRMSVVGADELTDEELDSFPLDDLSKLAEKILELMGVKSGEVGNDSPQKS